MALQKRLYHHSQDSCFFAMNFLEPELYAPYEIPLLLQEPRSTLTAIQIMFFSFLAMISPQVFSLTFILPCHKNTFLYSRKVQISLRPLVSDVGRFSCRTKRDRLSSLDTTLNFVLKLGRAGCISLKRNRPE